MNSSFVPRAAAAVVACVLSACGGGGGDGSGIGGSDGSSSSGSGGITVTMSHASVTSLGVNNSALTSDVVDMTLTGGSGTYYAAATSDNDTFNVDIALISGTEGAVTVTPSGSVPSGTIHSGHLTYKLCTDPDCTHVAWSRTVPYSITRFQVNPPSITLSGTEGIPVQAFNLAVMPADSTHLLTFTPSDPTVLTADHSDPSKVVLQFPTAHVGSLNATLGISFPGLSSPQDGALQIPVQLNIASDIVAPAPAPLTINASTSMQALTNTLPVSFVDAKVHAWSATSDKPWLVLDHAQDTNAAAIQYHVDRTQLGGITNWNNDTATISVSSDGLSTLNVPVTLAKQLPELQLATPAAVMAGEATTVHVTGLGLSQLAGVGQLSVNGAPVVSGTIVSDTAAVLQLPALPAGKASIVAANALSLAAPAAPVGVEAPGTFAATLVAHGGMNRAIAFDATRNAIYAANNGTDQYATAHSLVRYQLVGSNWTVATLPVNNIGLLALAPDRSAVYVGSGESLLVVDPDTLQVRTTVALPQGTSAASNFYFTEPLPVTNDLRLWISSDAFYDLRRGTFGTATASSASTSGLLYEPNEFGMASGNGLFVASCTCAQPIGPSYWYDPTTAQFQQVLPGVLINSATFDSTGALMLANDNTVYRTSDWSEVSRVDINNTVPGWNSGAGVLSPDGTRVYRQAIYGLPAQVDHIEVIDISSGADLGSIALPNKATTCSATGAYFCDEQGRLAMDPTGTTLFWVGEQGLAVVPIPPALSGVASAHGAGAGRLGKAASAANSR